MFPPGSEVGFPRRRRRRPRCAFHSQRQAPDLGPPAVATLAGRCVLVTVCAGAHVLFCALSRPQNPGTEEARTRFDLVSCPNGEARVLMCSGSGAVTPFTGSNGVALEQLSSTLNVLLRGGTPYTLTLELPDAPTRAPVVCPPTVHSTLTAVYVCARARAGCARSHVSCCFNDTRAFRRLSILLRRQDLRSLGHQWV